jgi:hypothetical protein
MAKDVQTLLVVWQNARTRLYYHIGNLSFYNKTYEFTYTAYGTGHGKIKDALNNGYYVHPAFPDINKVYRSDKLFAAFDRRLPSKDRSDFKAILFDLGLNVNSTKMDLLRETRGRLANDTYSFEQPLRVKGDGKLHSSFFVHGMRHRELPDNWSDWVALQDSVKLIQEPTNIHDPNAVAVYTYSGRHLGYVPGFYSKAIYSLLEYDANPNVKVIYKNEKSTPHWWLKLYFECEIPPVEAMQSSEVLSLIK